MFITVQIGSLDYSTKWFIKGFGYCQDTHTRVFRVCDLEVSSYPHEIRLAGLQKTPHAKYNMSYDDADKIWKAMRDNDKESLSFYELKYSI